MNSWALFIKESASYISVKKQCLRANIYFGPQICGHLRLSFPLVPTKVHSVSDSLASLPFKAKGRQGSLAHEEEEEEEGRRRRAE